VDVTWGRPLIGRGGAVLSYYCKNPLTFALSHNRALLVILSYFIIVPSFRLIEKKAMIEDTFYFAIPNAPPNDEKSSWHLDFCSGVFGIAISKSLRSLRGVRSIETWAR